MFSTSGDKGVHTAPWKFSHYVVLRLVGAGLVVFLVLTGIFIAVEVLPVEPLFITPPHCNPVACGAIRQQIIAQWGLDQPLANRYAIFLANVLTGNLGVSVATGNPTPVMTIIANALPTTLALLGVVLVPVALVALAVGLTLSKRKGSVTDAVVSLLLAIPFAITPAVLAFVAFYVFFVRLQWIQMPSPGQSFSLGFDAVAVVFIVGTLAGVFTWMVRDHPLRPPVGPPPAAGEWRTPPSANAGWLRRTIAVYLATLPALIAWTVAAVLLAEVIWDIRGVGLLLWTSLLRFDVITVMGILVVLGLGVLLPFMVAADILHEWLASDWVRRDGRSAEGFEVEPREASRGLRSLLESASGFGGIVLIALLLGMTLAAPLLVGPYPTALMLVAANQPPSAAHLLGTDPHGRDVLALVMYGATSAIPVALLAFALALWTGLGLVTAQGLFGPRADVFLSIPVDAGLILGSLAGGILSSLVLGRTLDIVPGLLAWPITSRILLLETRGLVRPTPRFGPRPHWSRGDRALKLVWGTSPLILGNAILSVAFAVAIWAAFGVLGLGLAGPSRILGWGELISLGWYNLAFLRDEWWLFVPQALCIMAAVIAPTLLAFGVKRIPLPGARRAQPAPVPVPPSETAAVPPS